MHFTPTQLHNQYCFYYGFVVCTEQTVVDNIKVILNHMEVTS